jgi:hypothetical protein
MTEKQVWFVSGTGHSLGTDITARVDIAVDEPSHIHVPRRRRVIRPGAAGNSATWNAFVRNEEHRATPTDSSAKETRGPSTALVPDAA